MERGENHELPRFCFEVNVPRGGRKLAVYSYTMVLTCRVLLRLLLTFIAKTVCFNQLFGGVKIFSIVLSKNDNFFNVSLFYFYEIH
jgi:hypothetical protein